jgi:hypothetical protein
METQTAMYNAMDMRRGNGKLLLALTMQFLVVLTAYPQNKTDREEAGLKRAVKTMRVEISSFIELLGGLRETHTNRQSFTSYNRQGNITSQAIYKGYDILVIENRALTKKDDLVSQGLYSYGDDGRLNTVVWVNSSGATVGRDVYVYGEDGLLAAKLEHMPENLLQNKQTYAYDDKGNRIAEEHYVSRGSGTQLTSRILFTYDETGRMKERSFYDGDGSKGLHPILSIHRITFNYDSGGKLTAQLAYDQKGSLRSRSEILYDSQGNMLEQTIHRKKDDRNPTKYRYAYEFDSFGNWIKMITSKVVRRKNKMVLEPDWVTYRFLTYY